MYSCSKMRVDNEVNVTGIYCATSLQKYDCKTINCNLLFYLSALRNFYLLASWGQLQCCLAVETEFVA